MAGEYEFGAEEEEEFSTLSSAMKFVGIAQIVFGLVRAVGGAVQGGAGNIAGGIVSAIVIALIGIWTVRAASSVQKIVDTEGSDVSHLMDAVGELTKLYSLQRLLIIIGIALLILLVGLGAAGALAG